MIAQPATATPLRHPALMAYYESWLSPRPDALAALPAMLDVVVLAFAKPDARYPGGLDLTGSGLQFPYPGAAVKDAVARLHRAAPGTRVMLAVGGSSYTNWAALAPDVIARLVSDLGLDGVDVDFEPGAPDCQPGPDGPHCASDAQWAGVLTRLRDAVPRPAILSVPGWSVGAYGIGPWKDAAPRSPWTGSMLRPLQVPGPAAIDLVSVMAYDAGAQFDPATAIAAYRAAWAGPLLGGVAVESGDRPTPGPDGLMIYGWLTAPPPGRPNALAIALDACRRWRTSCG